MIFIKLLMVVLMVGTIFFLSYIYPNIKTPKWQRKIISAKYLRDRQHFDLADETLEKTIKEFPCQTSLYHVYYKYYSTPGDMKKIFDIFENGYKVTGGDVGLGVVSAKFLIEEGETEKAKERIKSKEALEYMLTNNMPVEAELLYREEKYEEAERSFVDFYSRLYPEEKDEKDIFSNLIPEELLLLVRIRKRLNKNWKEIFRIIPVNSVMEEDDWKRLYEKLKEEREGLNITSGIYGPPEKLIEFRRNELDDKIALLEKMI